MAPQLPRAGLPRITFPNLLHTAGAVLVPSSEESGMPRSAVTRPHLGDMLRWRRGHDVVVDENDEIVFLETDPPGYLTGIIAPGHYSTPTDYAAAAQAAMMGAPGRTYTYTVTYSTGTKKITTTSSVAVILAHANQARSAHPDMGYTDVDKSGTSFEGTMDVYQSRRALHVDLLAAARMDAGVLRAHNLLATAAARFDGFDSTSVGVGWGQAGGTVVQLPLSGDPAFVSGAARRYLRLLLSDVSNPLGYNEAGIAWPGPYIDLPGFQVSVRDARVGLSEVLYAIGGAQHQVRRGTRKVWTLTAHRIDAAKKADLDAFNELAKKGGPFFFTFDTLQPGSTRYVFMPEEMVFESIDTDPVTWLCAMELAEVMA